jgi:hypothetical protein
MLISLHARASKERWDRLWYQVDSHFFRAMLHWCCVTGIWSGAPTMQRSLPHCSISCRSHSGVVIRMTSLLMMEPHAHTTRSGIFVDRDTWRRMKNLKNFIIAIIAGWQKMKWKHECTCAFSCKKYLQYTCGLNALKCISYYWPYKLGFLWYLFVSTL